MQAWKGLGAEVHKETPQITAHTESGMYLLT